MHIRELFSLAEKCAVVVGGAGKLGFPISEALAEAGARVHIASRRPETYSPRVEALRRAGLEVRGIGMDQSDEKSVTECLKAVTAEWKTPDILVNCGVQRPMRNYMDDTVEAWDCSMDVNARGLFITCRAFARAMAREGGGAIINVASIYGVVAPDQGLYEGTRMQTEPDYPYTKGGMIMFSKYLASCFAKDHVRVNCIAPGGFFHDQDEGFYKRYVAKVPLGRMAYHDDLKGAAVFLASAASAYITGAVVPIDGGFTVI